MSMVLGVDIGGTKIAAGLVTPAMGVRECLTVPTRAQEGFDVSVTQVYAAIDRLMTPEVKALGVCAPGPLNPKTGVVLNPPNLPGWRNIPLAQLLTARYHLPCRVENDANAAGLAEALYGAARGYDSVLYMTISTGVGTGIILNGKIYHGKNGAAAEGGHSTVDHRGPAGCNCGVPGCLEGLASGSAMARRAAALLPEYPGSMLHEPITAETIAAAAAQHDELASRILDESTEMIGAALGTMVSILDPDIIVIGGGVAQIGEPLFARLREIVPQRTINRFASETPIVPAQLAGQVGILGAAAVATQLI